ncbi:MAG: four helix bundle protein [Opitutus sp.]
MALDDLRVYAMAEQLADLVWVAVKPWEPFARSAVGHQLVRAADSVGATLALNAYLRSLRHDS